MTVIRHVTLEEAAEPIAPEAGTIYVFEDRWKSRRELIEKRLAAHQGRFRSIFARKCLVSRPDAATARRFLEDNHVYGYAKCSYRYGLEYEGELVAVSTFSAPRPITRMINGRERIVSSYEWVRAASLPDCRICGGMGRLLKAFIDEVHPDDIMTYADREWSEGGVYEKLGFTRTAQLPPQKFLVDPSTMRRISCRKVERDRIRGLGEVSANAVTIYNLGSIKYVLTLLGRQ